METEEEEDIKKIDAILERNDNDNADELFYDDFISYIDDDSDLEESLHLESGETLDIPKPPVIDIKTIYKYNITASLKPEEKATIELCTDTDLKKLLMLNRTRRMHLIQLYKIMKDLLIECKQNIIEKTELVNAANSSNFVLRYSRGWQVGAPYFKDSGHYPAPPNADAVRKRQNRELSVYNFIYIPKWRRDECNRLIDSVKFNYNLNLQAEVKRKIMKLMENECDKEDDRVKELEKQLDELKQSANAVPPLNSDKNIDWDRVSEKFIKDKYSSTECRSLWNLYLHPDINTTRWSEKEDKRLIKLVKQHKCQNWQAIADQLGTHRTILQTCTHFFRDVNKHYKMGAFTEEEDRLLLTLIDSYRVGTHIPWGTIGKRFKDRSRNQLYQRYTYYLSQNDRKRGKFSEAEDIMLMICVDRFGKDFNKCMEHLPLRTAVQCKTRYSSNCDGFTKKADWSIEEDLKILEHAKKNGPQGWSQLARKLHRFRAQVRQRYVTIINFLCANPDKTLEDVQRRQVRAAHLQAQEAYLRSRSIADTYKGKAMPTLETLENHVRVAKEKNNTKIENINEDAEQEDVDELLINFFAYSYRMNKPAGNINVDVTTKKVETVLDVLQAHLNIPDNIVLTEEIDSTDVAILRRLKQTQTANKQMEEISAYISRLIPPHLQTMVGLRCLLLTQPQRHSKMETHTRALRKSCTCPNAFVQDLINYLKKTNASQRSETEFQMRLFLERFISLFKWPCILSQEQPLASLDYSFLNLDVHNSPLKNKPVKSYSKRKKVIKTETFDNTENTSTESNHMNQVSLITPNKLKEDNTALSPEMMPPKEKKRCRRNSENNLSDTGLSSKISSETLTLARCEKEVGNNNNKFKIKYCLKPTPVAPRVKVEAWTSTNNTIDSEMKSFKYLEESPEPDSNTVTKSQHEDTAASSKVGVRKAECESCVPWSNTIDMGDIPSEMTVGSKTYSKRGGKKTEYVKNTVVSPNDFSAKPTSTECSIYKRQVRSKRYVQCRRKKFTLKFVNGTYKAVPQNVTAVEAATTNTKFPHLPLKLTPVENKSVIENLLKDKSKKLFTLNSVVNDGPMRMIAKEVKLDRHELEKRALVPEIKVLHGTTIKEISTNGNENEMEFEGEMDAVIEENDLKANLLLDIQKLNSVLGEPSGINV